MRDIMDNLDLKRAISPQAARTDNTPIVSQIVDLKGYDGCMLAIDVGTNTDSDATFTVLIEDGEAANLSDAAAVSDDYLNGLESTASFTAAADDNKMRKIGYVGIKRYVRATITPAANDAGNIFITANWVLRPLRRPAPNPPV
ncbi:hypothetical protein ABIF38_006417 [Bradyrhizobium japonicum]|uniref:hypothetical protein n=1 Tax=Bradyrhizobium elkanii TaxID=29448 RepID=UPI000381DB37|nr:hypothetical protein [Bradyrhizobium elkanii]WAX24348.1 hypothetical protein [Bradyrhizobium phage ppBeUSDA76-1]MCP1731275.1 hypothetical protein [Bradyrhizobium elkanii]MCS3575404.1 hypothetical protein [Bradyrhizobium elkanii]MCS3591905.1 hypothetical protein [Bradyrhizobium elkanii]MCS3621350.1 hypothetical protein [Bradyrhizobium elkanii]